MAKNDTTETNTITPPVLPAGADSRSITITHGGKTMKRIDYIRMRWAAKAGRGLIAKELSAIQYPDGSKKVPYQVVYQATKGVPGGPDTPEAGE